MDRYPDYLPETNPGTNPGTTQATNEESTTSRLAGWHITLFALLAVLIGYAIYAQRVSHSQILARFDEVYTNMKLMQARTTALEQDYAELKAHAQITAENLTLTGQQLARARALAAKIKKEQQQTNEQLRAELEQQGSQLGSLRSSVSEVQGDVTQTQQSLQDTRTKLDHAVGDLGVQSGLIAHTREELAELRRRGERDYFDFDLRKSAEFTRVGDILVRLNRVDPKRNKFTVTLLVNDKRIEKKDRTLYEPVQFYLQKSHALLELVVFEVGQNRVVGYLSAPKELAMQQPPSQP